MATSLSAILSSTFLPFLVPEAQAKEGVKEGVKDDKTAKSQFDILDYLGSLYTQYIQPQPFFRTPRLIRETKGIFAGAAYEKRAENALANKIMPWFRNHDSALVYATHLNLKKTGISQTSWLEMDAPTRAERLKSIVGRFVEKAHIGGIVLLRLIPISVGDKWLKNW